MDEKLGQSCEIWRRLSEVELDGYRMNEAKTCRIFWQCRTGDGSCGERAINVGLIVYRSDLRKVSH